MRFYGNGEKTRVANWKKYPLEAILLSFVFCLIFYSKDALKSPLYDHIENSVETKFQNHRKCSFGVHNPSFLYEKLLTLG